jgi:hypothetical protein
MGEGGGVGARPRLALADTKNQSAWSWRHLRGVATDLRTDGT